MLMSSASGKPVGFAMPAGARRVTAPVAKLISNVCKKIVTRPHYVVAHGHDRPHVPERYLTHERTFGIKAKHGRDIGEVQLITPSAENTPVIIVIRQTGQRLETERIGAGVVPVQSPACIGPDAVIGGDLQFIQLVEGRNFRAGRRHLSERTVADAIPADAALGGRPDGTGAVGCNIEQVLAFHFDPSHLLAVEALDMPGRKNPKKTVTVADDPGRIGRPDSVFVAQHLYIEIRQLRKAPGSRREQH